MLTVGTALFFFAANPAFFACSEEEDFTFGQSEMADFVVGTWTGSLTNTDGTSIPFTLVLKQSTAVQASSPLCGTREFMATADACMAMSTLGVKGTFDTDDGVYTAAPVEGNFEVNGADFNNSSLYLTFPGDQMTFSATGDEKGFKDASLYQPSTSMTPVKATLTKAAP